VLKEFSKYIEANVDELSLSGAGRNLYVGRRPQDAPDVSAVVEEPVPDPTDPILTDVVEKTFRVECRGNPNDYFSARDLATSIHSALHGQMQVSLPVVSGPTYVVNIKATEPASVGPDDKHRPIIVMYFYVNVQEE